MTLRDYLANPFGKGSNVAPTNLIQDSLKSAGTQQDESIFNHARHHHRSSLCHYHDCVGPGNPEKHPERNFQHGIEYNHDSSRRGKKRRSEARPVRNADLENPEFRGSEKRMHVCGRHQSVCNGFRPAGMRKQQLSYIRDGSRNRLH